MAKGIFDVNVIYPGEHNGRHIEWPEGAPLPGWGETFVDLDKNGPDGSGVYCICDTTWTWRVRPSGPEVIYLIQLCDGCDCEEDD